MPNQIFVHGFFPFVIGWAYDGSINLGLSFAINILFICLSVLKISGLLMVLDQRGLFCVGKIACSTILLDFEKIHFLYFFSTKISSKWKTIDFITQTYFWACLVTYFCSVFANTVEKWAIFQNHNNSIPGALKNVELSFWG